MISQEIVRFVKKLKKKGIYPGYKTIHGCQTDPVVNIDGKEYILFCSNNYLGLANSKITKDSAVEAIEKYGYGSGASRWISGTTELHEKLEQNIASFKSSEKALTFSAGFMANSGVIPALTMSFMGHYPFEAEKCEIFSDQLNHASIIDGCRASKAETTVYRHKDVKDLERALDRSTKPHKLIVTDSVFSMDGDITPIPELIRLCKEYKAMLMVDDAHATGVIGLNGRGSAEHFNCEGEIDITMGTFSKALGCLGGFVTSDEGIIDYLKIAARTYVFSTAMPAVTAAVLLNIIDLLVKDNTLVNKLAENCSYLREGLKKLGLNTLESETAIIPILIGNEARAVKFAEALLERGVFVSSVRWPAVPHNQSRLRVTVMASHSRDNIDHLLNALNLATKRKGLSKFF